MIVLTRVSPALFSPALFVFFALVCVTCGDQAGNPIVLKSVNAGEAAVADASLGQGGAGPDAEPPAGAAGLDAGADVVGIMAVGDEGGGLCEPCGRNSDCGGRDDFCVVNVQTLEQFCGSDCTEVTDCPEDFVCAGLLNSDRSQCAPATATCRDIDGGT